MDRRLSFECQVINKYPLITSRRNMARSPVLDAESSHSESAYHSAAQRRLVEPLFCSTSTCNTHDKPLEPAILSSEAFALAFELNDTVLKFLCAALEGSFALLLLQS